MDDAAGISLSGEQDDGEHDDDLAGGRLIWQVLDIIGDIESTPDNPHIDLNDSIQRLRLDSENALRRQVSAIKQEREKRVRKDHERFRTRPRNPPDRRPAALRLRLKKAAYPPFSPRAKSANAYELKSRKPFSSFPSLPGSSDSLEEAEATYEQLLSFVEAEVDILLSQLAEWNRQGPLSRMLSRSEQPPDTAPPILIGLIDCLDDWAKEITDMRRRAERYQPPSFADLDERQREAERESKQRLNAEIAALRLKFEAERLKFETERTEVLSRSRQALDAIVASTQVTARAWDDLLWRTAAPPPGAGADIRIGTFAIEKPDAARFWEAPATLHFPFDAGLFIDCAGEARTAAIGLGRAVCVRLLAAAPAGKLHFTFIDPVALGQSVADFQHLADFDKRLVGIKPVTAAREIEERLAALSAHVEVVISEYLRGQFRSIDEYNAVAGELAEPYRVLVVFDYPAGFSEQAAQQLLSLAENGPQCGVHVIVVADSGASSHETFRSTGCGRTSTRLTGPIRPTAGRPGSNSTPTKVRLRWRSSRIPPRQSPSTRTAPRGPPSHR